MDNEDEQKILKKALKLYVTGKDIYNSNDKEKAKLYFEKSLNTLTELKNIDKIKKYTQLIETTEADCIKYLKTSNNIFEMVQKNDLEGIKNIEHINFREINEFGNTVLHHAIDVGDTGILKEILKKGGMIDTVNGNGHTLLEYACLKKDPNMIQFMINHGSNMQKHLFFRKGENKYYLNKSDIDMAILLKLVCFNSLKTDSQLSFSFLDNFFNTSDLVGFDKFTIRDIMKGLHYMFKNKDSYETYKKIIIEELTVFEETKTLTKCIYNKIDLVLVNLVPFINYPFNIGSIFVLKNEIKHLIKYILVNNKKDYKNILLSKLFEYYIQTNLFPEDYIGIIVYNILSKLKTI